MKRTARRLLLGLGMFLFVGGVGLCWFGHEVLRALIGYAVEDKAQFENVVKMYGVGTFLAAVGAGILAASVTRTREKADVAPGS